MSTMSQLGEFLATIQNQQDARTAALEERLSQLEGNEEGKGECVCGTYDEFLAAYEERIAALEGGGGNTEPIPASQALEEYGFLLCGYKSTYEYHNNKNLMALLSNYEHRINVGGSYNATSPPNQDRTVVDVLCANEGDIVKAYTPDLQEIEIIADTTLSYYCTFGGLCPMAFCNVETKEVRCYQLDSDNKLVSPCTDEEFIAQYGNSAAYGL